jgi:hypothetical protein
LRALFSLLTGAFGLLSDNHPYHFSGDRIVEANARLNIWDLLQCGGLVEGTTTRLAWGEKTYRLASRPPNLWIGRNPIPIVWDEPMEGVARPWFECRCGRRCRHIFLDELPCRKCLRLDYASRHLHRPTPAVHRVARLRRKLGADPRPFAPLPARPPGRSKAYHERLIERIRAEEQALVEHLGTITRALERRITVRQRKHQW